MNKTVTVSAPGKLMLFGEHAVLFGYPCIVTAVNQRLQLTVEEIAEQFLIIDAPDVQITNYRKPLSQLGEGDIPKGVAFIERAIKNFIHQYPLSLGIHITTHSAFKSTFGFGSSSAVAVCAVKGIAGLFGINLLNKDVFEIAYKAVLDVQGKGSGFDIAAATYGGTLYFVTGGQTISPFTTSYLPLIVGYTGVKADTVTLINQVSQREARFPNVIKDIYNSIGDLIPLATEAITDNDWRRGGELMDINQGYLESLGVGSSQLASLIYAARGSGAFGAKLSGAGGGDCMIAFCSKESEEKVKEAIKKAGGQVMEVEANAEGVRIEK